MEALRRSKLSRDFVIGQSHKTTRPILQAPLGSLTSPELVAAVSGAGGIGSLALTWTNPAAAAKLVARVKALTPAPFMANFVLSFKPLALTAALEAGVPILTFSWGLPGALVRTAHSFGAAVGVQVSTVEGAQRALDSGSDFIICQGIEAGGHVQSSTPLRELLHAVIASAKGVPVVAAGGLGDGADIAEVIAMGASAAMLGTRFVASAESLAHPAYKASLLAAGKADTVLTGCFDGGWPYALHRVLRNATLTAWESSGSAPVGSRPGEGDVVVTTLSGEVIRRYSDMPPVSQMKGDPLACCLYAGTGVGKIKEVRPAGDLVKDLWASALLALGSP